MLFHPVLAIRVKMEVSVAATLHLPTFATATPLTPEPTAKSRKLTNVASNLVKMEGHVTILESHLNAPVPKGSMEGPVK